MVSLTRRDTFLPLQIDKYLPNEDIKVILSPTFASFRNIRFRDFLDNLILSDISDETWLYNAIYDSGIYEQLTIFNIEKEDTASIKALVDYDYNPTRKSLAIFFNNLVGVGNYSITESQGVVNVVVGNIPDIKNNLVVNESSGVNNLISQNTVLTDNLVEIIKSEVIFNAQLNFLYDTYVAIGIKLNITINTY